MPRASSRPPSSAAGSAAVGLQAGRHGSRITSRRGSRDGMAAQPGARRHRCSRLQPRAAHLLVAADHPGRDAQPATRPRRAISAIRRESWPPCQASGDSPGSSGSAARRRGDRLGVALSDLVRVLRVGVVAALPPRAVGASMCGEFVPEPRGGAARGTACESASATASGVLVARTTAGAGSGEQRSLPCRTRARAGPRRPRRSPRRRRGAGRRRAASQRAGPARRRAGRPV